MISTIGKYNYLEEVFGKELIDSIPEVESPIMNEWIEMSSTSPYPSFDAFPHDVVKMVLPTGRLAIAFRFISLNQGVYKQHIESWRYYPNGNLMNRVTPWTTPTHDPVWNRWELNEQTIILFKSMLSGAPLKKTEYRYLPKFGEEIGEITV